MPAAAALVSRIDGVTAFVAHPRVTAEFVSKREPGSMLWVPFAVRGTPDFGLFGDGTVTRPPVPPDAGLSTPASSWKSVCRPVDIVDRDRPRVAEFDHIAKTTAPRRRCRQQGGRRRITKKTEVPERDRRDPPSRDTSPVAAMTGFPAPQRILRYCFAVSALV